MANEVEVVNLLPAPKPPQEKHKALHWLSYNFYLARKQIGDNFYDPWDPKELAHCKLIIEKKARGNIQEANRRATNLVFWNRIDPNFWTLLPAELLAKWSRLHTPPSVPGRDFEALKNAVFQIEQKELQRRIEESKDWKEKHGAD